jgi:hypothetical protein
LAPPALLQVFYYVIMAVFGAVKGLVQLNLGNITSFQVGPARQPALLLGAFKSFELLPGKHHLPRVGTSRE